MVNISIKIILMLLVIEVINGQTSIQYPYFCDTKNRPQICTKELNPVWMVRSNNKQSVDGLINQ